MNGGYIFSLHQNLVDHLRKCRDQHSDFMHQLKKVETLLHDIEDQVRESESLHGDKEQLGGRLQALQVGKMAFIF